MQQTLFQFFYHKKLDFLKLTEKELQKPCPKLKLYIHISNIYRELCSACNRVQMVAFCKHVLS